MCVCVRVCDLGGVMGGGDDSRSCGEFLPVGSVPVKALEETAVVLVELSQPNVAASVM